MRDEEGNRGWVVSNWLLHLSVSEVNDGVVPFVSGRQ